MEEEMSLRKAGEKFGFGKSVLFRCKGSKMLKKLGRNTVHSKEEEVSLATH